MQDELTVPDIQANAPDNSIDQANVNVPLPERFFYCLPDAGHSALNFLLSSFLTIYLTDIIGIAGAFVSALLLVARIADAVNDPIIGSLADRTKTRFGRYKPWIFFGSIASAITVTLVFSNNPSWPYAAKAAFAVVTYLSIDLATTAMYIPQVALNGIMTSNSKVRSNLASWRMVASNLGTAIIPVITMSLILMFSRSNGKADAQGYTLAAMLICAVAGAFGIAGSIAAKERLDPPKQQKRQNIPLKMQMTAILKNPAILLLMICFIIHGFVAYGRGAVLMYYFTYYVGDVNLYRNMGIAGLIGSFVGPIVVATYLHRVTRHKGRAAAIALLVVAAMYLTMAITDPRNIIWWICTTIASTFQGSFATTVFAAIPEAADSGELLSGYRVDGFLASAVTFGLKVGGAIGPAIYIALYAAAGYVPNTTQNATVLQLINASVTYIPATFVAVIGLLMLFGYKISEARHDEILNELKIKRSL